MAYPPPGGGYGYPPSGGPGYPPGGDMAYPPSVGGYPHPAAGSAYPPGGDGYPQPQYPQMPYGGVPPYGSPQPPPGGMPYGQSQPGYGAPYGQPVQPPYGAPQPQSQAPYGGNPPYGAPPQQPYGSHQQQQPYGGMPQPQANQPPPAHQPQGHAPQQYNAPPQGYAPKPDQSHAPPPHQPQQNQPVQPKAPARPAAPSTVQPTQPPTSQMANMSMTARYGTGTVVGIQPFDAEADCELLRKSMRGLGTDENQLISILANRSNAQRVEIRLRYKTMFGKDLMNDLKSELSGNLEECLLAMMEPSVLYDAKCLRRAMRGAGTDEETLIDILCSRSNADIRKIKDEYRTYYKRDLEKDCVSETSGHFKRLLVSMCQGNRDESGSVDIEKARKEANDLFQAGEKKWGTDESRFNVVLASRNFNQLKATFDEYVKISQRDILNSIDREMSGDLKQGFKCIVQCARNPSSYFAERLYKSMKGVGTDDSLLIRIVVSRSEVDLVEIKREFLRMYHKTLYKMIQGDCSGDYKKLLLALVKSDV